jgi:hypothetical protein
VRTRRNRSRDYSKIATQVAKTSGSSNNSEYVTFLAHPALMLTKFAVLITSLCYVPMSRKVTCTPRMAPVINALHPCIPSNTDSILLGERPNHNFSVLVVSYYVFVFDIARASTATRSGMLFIAPLFSTHIPAA